ncbi:MAG: magnesium transporter [Phycisphaerales bacterium]
MTPIAELLLPEIQELIKNGQYGDLRDALHHLHPADVAELLSNLPNDQEALAFRFLLRDDAATTFSYLTPEQQEELITALGTEQSARFIEQMSGDDRARLVDEMPEACAQRVLGSLSPQSRREVQAILGYPEKSVGRIMTPDYVQIRPEWTAGQAIEHIRTHGRDAETVNVVYVTDNQGRLVDDIRLRQIIFADPGTSIEDLMNRSFVTLTADQPQSDAVQLLTRYDRTALPVVDSRGVLLGIVTHDDIADVAQQEATEEVQRIGGTAALEAPFDRATVLDLVKKRAPSLSLLFLAELLTSNALVYFEDEIAKAAVLAAFIPAIISSGGNSGSQSSTLVIRALALGEIKVHDWWQVLRRELVVAGSLGAIIGVIGFFRINLWGWLGWWKSHALDPDTHKDLHNADGTPVWDMSVQHHYTVLAVTIAVSLFGVVLWGSVMGAMVPFILKKCKLDPAGSSTPFVATLVDVTGIIIYFTCAMVILKGTLL